MPSYNIVGPALTIRKSSPSWSEGGFEALLSSGALGGVLVASEVQLCSAGGHLKGGHMKMGVRSEIRTGRVNSPSDTAFSKAINSTGKGPLPVCARASEHSLQVSRKPDNSFHGFAFC